MIVYKRFPNLGVEINAMGVYLQPDDKSVEAQAIVANAPPHEVIVIMSDSASGRWLKQWRMSYADFKAKILGGDA